MDRIIWNAQKVFNLNKRTKSDILPSEIIHSVKELRIVFILNCLQSLRGTDYLINKTVKKTDDMSEYQYATYYMSQK